MGNGEQMLHADKMLYSDRQLYNNKFAWKVSKKYNTER